MICPITDKPCRTNGCGEKCYKKDSLGYSTAPQHIDMKNFRVAIQKIERKFKDKPASKVVRRKFEVKSDSSETIKFEK